MSSRDPQDYFGSGSFDSDDFGQGDGLSIDTADDGPRRDATLVSPGAPALQKETASEPEPGKARRRAWPTGKSPESASIQIDIIEVRVVSDFGDAPSSFLLAPAYTLRVAKRRRVLRDRVKQLAAALTATEYERDCLVVAMVRDLRGKILLTEQGEKLFEPVVALERTALDRKAALAGKSAEYDRRSAELEELRTGIESDVETRRELVEQRRAELTEQRRSFDRAEAKKKRLYIEVRTIVEAAEKNGGVSTAAQSARLSELEAEIAAQKPELESLSRNVEAAKLTVASAEQDAKQLAGKLRNAERLRSELDQEFQKEIGTRSQGVTEAEKQRFDALAAVGHGVLAARGRVVDVADSALDAMIRAEATVLERTTELEKSVRALDAFDAPTYRRGLLVAASALGIIMLAIGFLLAR